MSGHFLLDGRHLPHKSLLFNRACRKAGYMLEYAARVRPQFFSFDAYWLLYNGHLVCLCVNVAGVGGFRWKTGVVTGCSGRRAGSFLPNSARMPEGGERVLLSAVRGCAGAGRGGRCGGGMAVCALVAGKK